MLNFLKSRAKQTPVSEKTLDCSVITTHSKKQYVYIGYGEEVADDMPASMIRRGFHIAEHIEDGIRPTDILLDDYSRNLHEWAACNAHGIKVYNGINGTHGTWDGEYISSSMSPDAIVRYICQSIVRRNMLLPSMAGAYTC